MPLPEKTNRLKIAAKDLMGVGPQMPAKDLLVHGAKIDRVLQVAVIVEVLQVGVAAVDP